MAATTRRIVVAIDGSKQAEEAFNWYFSFIHKPENEVILVHVPEGPTTTTSHGMHLNEGEWQKMLQKEKQETEALQSKFTAKLADYHAEASYKTVYGKPGEAIVQAGSDLEATMIVTGTRGLGKVRRTIMGSVSDYIVHHSHCPVVVCRH